MTKKSWSVTFFQYLLMYKIFFFIFLVCTSLSSPGQGHWLVPQRYFYSIREMAYIQLRDGPEKKGLAETIPVTAINSILHYRPNGSVTSLDKLVANPDKDSIALPLQEAGTHMVILQQNRGPVTIPVDSLEKLFLPDEVPAKFRNEPNNFTPKKEIHIQVQESLKTLLQVSEDLTNACTHPSGLLLDIIPEENPNTIPRPSWREGPVNERFRILLKGKPLAHTWVAVTYQVSGKGWQTMQLQTDKKGRILAERHPGAYRLSCIYSQPSENDPAFELVYYWGSLYFDYSQYFR